jgi:hypothetical protein
VVGPATSTAQPVTLIVRSECDDKEGAAQDREPRITKGKVPKSI